jgi:hypothetical protein
MDIPICAVPKLPVACHCLSALMVLPTLSQIKKRNPKPLLLPSLVMSQPACVL